jgi:hypothetical protein
VHFDSVFSKLFDAVWEDCEVMQLSLSVINIVWEAVKGRVGETGHLKWRLNGNW